MQYVLVLFLFRYKMNQSFILVPLSFLALVVVAKWQYQRTQEFNRVQLEIEELRRENKRLETKLKSVTKKMEGPIIIAIVGTTCSGKTTALNMIGKNFNKEDIALVSQDRYYKTAVDPKNTNFDDISAIDVDLLIDHIKLLKSGKSVDGALYCFETHKRLDRTEEIKPAKLIIVEGILLLADERLRELFDSIIYIETDRLVRFARRILRDTKERGRDVEGVIEQFLGQVVPSEEQFIVPYKKYADQIFENSSNGVFQGLDTIIPYIERLLEQVNI